jgi:hypothetical protein
MHRELLAHSPLLALPLFALLLFMFVWVATAVRVMTRSRADLEEAARLPLESDHGR